MTIITRRCGVSRLKVSEQTQLPSGLWVRNNHFGRYLLAATTADIDRGWAVVFNRELVIRDEHSAWRGRAYRRWVARRVSYAFYLHDEGLKQHVTRFPTLREALVEAEKRFWARDAAERLGG